MLEDPPVHQQERSCLSGRPRLGQSSRRSRTQVSVSEARGLDRQELDRNMIGGEVAYPSQGLWAGYECSGEEEETRKKWNQGGPVDGGHLHELYVSDGCHAANTSLTCFLQITLKFDLPVTVSILYNSNPHKVCHPWIQHFSIYSCWFEKRNGCCTDSEKHWGNNFHFHLEYRGILEAKHREDILVDEEAKNKDDDKDWCCPNIHTGSTGLNDQITSWPKCLWPSISKPHH